MGREIEAKIAVDSHEPLREALRAAGATPLGRRLETNIFFDTAGEGLLKSDRGLRLRIDRDAQSVILTVKGPRLPGPLKNREEIELEVTDSAAATRFFELLGFERQVSFEKRRESWKLQACQVELDEVPILGRFLEVEGPDVAAIESVLCALGVADRPTIQESYIALITQRLQQDGRNYKDIRF